MWGCAEGLFLVQAAAAGGSFCLSVVQPQGNSAEAPGMAKDRGLPHRPCRCPAWTPEVPQDNVPKPIPVDKDIRIYPGRTAWLLVALFLSEDYVNLGSEVCSEVVHSLL